MKHLTTDEILLGIRQKNDHILNMIYSEAYPTIEKYILQNRGNEQDAEDVFQEAMIIVYKRIRDNELELSCKFGTYLYAICKNIWMQERKKFIQRTEKLRQRLAEQEAVLRNCQRFT